MKKISIVVLLLLLTTLSVEASENNGVQEVKTGLAAVFTSDNDGDGIKDRDDLCKDTAVTPTHEDSNKDGCDDNTAALLNKMTPTSTNAEKDKVEANKEKPEPEPDEDLDGISDDMDGCLGYAPTIDNNENGCEDNTIRTMYNASEVGDDYFAITGIAFVDGQPFSTPDTYTTEVEIRNAETNEYITGKVATNYPDTSIDDSIIGATEDITYSAFAVMYEASDLAGLCDEGTECANNTPNDEVKYKIDITLTDQEGQKYTETLFSFDEKDNGNESGAVRIQVIDHRVYFTIS